MKQSKAGTPCDRPFLLGRHRVTRRGTRPPDADALLREAIARKRLVAFTLDDLPRIGEPHDYGIVNGTARLFFYQTGGASRSGRPLGWRWARLDKISDLTMLSGAFRGSRPAPSGRHVHWDVLLASVSPRPTPRPPRTASSRRRRRH